MSEKKSCAHCEAVREVELVQVQEEIEFRGKPVPYAAVFFRCTTCGEEFETPEQMDANLDAIRESFERIYATPQPEELIALRNKYGASQKAFGILLNFGEATMNTYEQGTTAPNPPNRLLLKLAASPAAFLQMYELNKHKIGELQRNRIESSGGYQEAIRWAGLSALTTNLSPMQMEKITHCAEEHHLSVAQQIATYVASGSFSDYSRLMTNATWSSPSTQKQSVFRSTDTELPKEDSFEAIA